jgi:signal transduction histidine kinase
MVNITLETDILNNKKLSPIRSSHVFAIVNESLANTVRHAHAQNVEIRAHDQGTQLQIEIKDDGAGIPLEPNAGYGLRNMRDRARLLNGELKFASNKGTMVTLIIPWIDQ